MCRYLEVKIDQKIVLIIQALSFYRNSISSTSKPLLILFLTLFLIKIFWHSHCWNKTFRLFFVSFEDFVDQKHYRLFLAGILEEFKRQFELRKDMPAMKPNAPPWTFNSSAVFARLDAFLKRLSDIEWLFNTVMEFSKLEKIEIGGILGRSLSTRIVNVYKEFQQLFVSFTVRATDALEPDDESFTVDCAKFNESITDLDCKLAAILCQAFDDCGNLESVFKVPYLVALDNCGRISGGETSHFSKNYSSSIDLLSQCNKTKNSK